MDDYSPVAMELWSYFKWVIPPIVFILSGTTIVIATEKNDAADAGAALILLVIGFLLYYCAMKA